MKTLAQRRCPITHGACALACGDHCKVDRISDPHVPQPQPLRTTREWRLRWPVAIAAACLVALFMTV